MQVALSNDVVARLVHALALAGSKEIGGILMAEQLNEAGQFRVVDFSVDPHSGKADYFQRDPSTHGAVLEAFFERNGHDYARFNYLGEWHSHPTFPVRPSLRDMKTMLHLVNGDEGIDFALLMIVKLIEAKTMECSTTLFTRGQRPSVVNLAADLATGAGDGQMTRSDDAAGAQERLQSIIGGDA